MDKLFYHCRKCDKLTVIFINGSICNIMSVLDHFFSFLTFFMPFAFFFFGFLFFMISAWNYLTGWDIVSGRSKRKIVLFYFTSFKSFFAIASGIQLFLKLYLAIVWLFLTIEMSYFSIFSSIVSPMSSL
jgi:hypothetical protein